MSALVTAYLVYYLLAGVAGIALYPAVVKICWARWVDYLGGFADAAQKRDLLLSSASLVLCCGFVEFCFGRAATLVAHIF